MAADLFVIFDSRPIIEPHKIGRYQGVRPVVCDPAGWVEPESLAGLGNGRNAHEQKEALAARLLCFPIEELADFRDKSVQQRNSSFGLVGREEPARAHEVQFNAIQIVRFDQFPDDRKSVPADTLVRVIQRNVH